MNKVSSQTGVKAVINANTVVGSGFAPVSASGNIYINGTTIAITSTLTTKAIDIVTTINQWTGSTGVVASDNGSGVTLTAADGRNISLSSDAALTDAGLGLVAPSSASAVGNSTLINVGGSAGDALLSYGGITLVSDKSFTVAGGAKSSTVTDLATLGLQEGTYGGSNNGIKIRDLNISTVSGSNDALSAVDAALSQISDMRSNLGAIQNRLQSAIENLTSSQTNMQQSVSRIQDTEYGTATTALSRAQIINQAATAMLAQANQQSQLVLQLLK